MVGRAMGVMVTSPILHRGSRGAAVVWPSPRNRIVGNMKSRISLALLGSLAVLAPITACSDPSSKEQPGEAGGPTGGLDSVGAGGAADGLGGDGLGVGGTSGGGTSASGGAASAPLSGGGPAVGGSGDAMGGADPVSLGGSGGSIVGSGGTATTGTGGAASPNTGGADPVGAGGADPGGVGGTDPGSSSGGAAQATGGSEPGPDDDDEIPSLIGAVSFTVPSQTFVGELAVGMSAANANAEIRYTLDGTLPVTTSTLYDGTPLALTETAELRAQSFLAGLPLGKPSTALYIRRTFEYSSDIPLVIMEGYGAGKPANKEDWVDLAFMTFEPVNGAAELAQLPTLAVRAGYHLRGQSSMNFPKTPYRIELWDNEDDDEDYPLLGMPAESDWAMIGPCSDSSLIRNAFVYDIAAAMGLASMRLRFAEVFINQDGGPLEETDYEGVYAVTETIKNQKHRLDLKQLEPEDTELPDITGGYIFKFDQMAVEEGETEIFCTLPDGTIPQESTGGMGMGMGGSMVDGCWTDLELVDPDPTNDVQMQWIAAHLQTFHDLMHQEPLGDYKSMMNVASFVDLFIINEVTRDVDANIRSHFMHKDREGLITAGPVWDYNFSLGNIGNDLEGWQWEEGRAGSTDWHLVMAQDPEFMAAVQVRWQELRAGMLSDADVVARIDALSAPLMTAGPRDNQRWPVGECFSWNFPGGGFGDQGVVTLDFTGDGTWPGEVEVLKRWTLERMAWLDQQLL